jgi:DNA mismatch endonuclease (patch repair protein)
MAKGKRKRIAAKTRSQMMSMIRGANTGPELRLRKALRDCGLHYVVTPKDVPGRPDVVFRGAKVAVFCDGDFWHGRGWKKDQDHPEFHTHRRFWIRKIERNMARDEEVNAALQEDGWTVLRFWASDIENDALGLAKEISSHVQENQSAKRRHRTKKHCGNP